MAITPIASVSTGSTSGSSVTTSAINTTGANLLIVSYADSVNTSSSSFTDSKGNTWISLTPHSEGSTTPGTRNRMFYCYPPAAKTGTGHTFGGTSLIGVGAGFPSLSVLAFSGLLANGFDQQNGSSTSSTVSSASTGNLVLTSPGQDNELIITGVNGGAGSNPAPGTPSGYTIGSSVSASANHFSSAIAYIIQTTAATASATWTFGTATRNSMTIASFRSVATGNNSQGFFELIV